MSDAAVPTEKKKKIYFPNLNGIRAIASLMVVVAHIELGKEDFTNLVKFDNPALQNMGRVGVSVFFALSGFLITYLLLEEKRNFQKIGMADFYMRRILRIWPLYFLVVIIGFFIYPTEGSSTALWLSVFFLPNLAFALKLLPALYDPIWSIGTEEQFYIFHPHFFRFKTVKQIFFALLIFLIGFLAVVQVIRRLQGTSEVMAVIAQLTYYIRFDNMAVGALVAVLYYNKNNKVFTIWLQKPFELIFNKFVQVLIYLVLIPVMYLYAAYHFPEGDLLIAILSALMIANLCDTENSILKLSHPAFKYIGEISYGIYLLHKFPVYFVEWYVSKNLGGISFAMQNVIIYAASFVLAIALASASYYGYERYFLTLKKRFAKITQH